MLALPVGGKMEQMGFVLSAGVLARARGPVASSACSGLAWMVWLQGAINVAQALVLLW